MPQENRLTVDKMDMLLKSPQTPRWMHEAALELNKLKDPLDAANQARFLYEAVLEKTMKAVSR